MKRKIKVLGCSVCKLPYDYSAGIKYDSSRAYAQIPLCKDDEKHITGYTDILIEVESNIKQKQKNSDVKILKENLELIGIDGFESLLNWIPKKYQLYFCMNLDNILTSIRKEWCE